MKYAFIHEQRTPYNIERLCQVMAVSRSGYYAWLKREMSTRADGELMQHIEQVHTHSYRIYGSRRVHAELLRHGVACSHYKVARLICTRSDLT